MIRQMARVAVLATLTLAPGVMFAARPATAQDRGAMAGGSYVPSTHSQGCSGFMCDGNDPRRAVGAPPPPPCDGLLCTVSPFGMERPVTAAEAQRLQEERARTATAAPPAAETEKPKRGARHKKAKTAKKAAKAKTVAARTPDPSPAAPPASR